MIFWVSFTLTSGLIFTCLEHIAFFTNNFPQMCLMLDHIGWGAFITLMCRHATALNLLYHKYTIVIY